MSFWRCAYSLKLPIFYKKNSLNFAQVCCYQIGSIHNITGKKSILNSDLCIYERRCTFFKRTTNEYENILKVKDSVPEDYRLVYRIPFVSYLKMARYVVLGSTVVLPFIIADNYLYPLMNEVYYEKFFINQLEFNIFLVMFILTNVVISSFISKYTIRMYANEDGKFKSIFLGFLPWKLKTLSYEKGDVVKVEPYLTILPWSDSYFRIKTKKTIILPYYFRKPSDLTDMLKCEEDT